MSDELPKSKFAPAQAVARAREAEQLMANPLLQETLEIMRGSVSRTWERSDPADVEGRERLYYMARGVRMFEASLRSVMETGKLVLKEREAEELRRAAEGVETSGG